MSVTPAQQKAERLHRGWPIILVVMCLGFLSVGIDEVLHFKDAPIDGPFQLFNALRRLAAGQHFGGSFQYFHGPGVPYLHYLPFLLMGKTFLASELSREIVSITAAIAVTVGFFRAWTRGWREAIPLAVVGLLMLIPLRVNALLFPINSMLGLRATMPLVVAIHLRLRGTEWRASLERALLLGLTIFCGIEQGTATIAAFGLLMAITAIRRRDAMELVRAIAAAAGGVLFFVVLTALVTPHGFGSVLQYNFHQVPADQLWFFGGPPNWFLYRWSQLTLFIGSPVWTALVLVMVVWSLRRFWLQGRSSERSDVVAEGFLAIYALASCGSMLGTLALVYFQPAVRVALFLAVVAARREWLAHRDDPRLSEELRAKIPRYAIATAFVATVLGWPLATILVVRTPFHILYAHGLLREPPTMTPEWKEMEAVGKDVVARERARLGHAPVIWSTYSSIVEYEAGVFHPFFDYIIHALGHDNRVAYADKFVATKPDIVQTLRPTYSSYEEWLETNYWSFYRPLFRDYTIAASGPWTYFWLPRATPFREDPRLVADTPIPPGQLAIAIPASDVRPGEPEIFEVSLRYHIDNPLSRVPIAGALPRYIIRVSNARNHVTLSLAPYETRRVFPVLVDSSTDIHLLGEALSLIGRPRLFFDSIRVVRIRIAPENLPWVRDFVTGPKIPVGGFASDSSRRR